MRTLGIDLATEGSPTGVCVIDWRQRKIICLDVGPARKAGLSTDQLAGWINGTDDRPRPDRVAIDAPFGFPAAFSQAVHRWRSGSFTKPRPDQPCGLGGSSEANWKAMNRRITDAHVENRMSELKKSRSADGWQTWPLSSVVERITPTVLRCAELLSLLNEEPVDRTGFSGRVLETYPIAALRIWLQEVDDIWPTLWSSPGAAPGYKSRKDGADEARRRLANVLLDRSGIDCGDYGDALRKSDDAIDAFVCALVARLRGRRGYPRGLPPKLTQHEKVIRTEGWIHLPPSCDSLGALT